MKKEEVLKILSKIPQSMYIRLEYDMGAIEGKIFKDKKIGTFLIYGAQEELFDLNFTDAPDDIYWLENIQIAGTKMQ